MELAKLRCLNAPEPWSPFDAGRKKDNDGNVRGKRENGRTLRRRNVLDALEDYLEEVDDKEIEDIALEEAVAEGSSSRIDFRRGNISLYNRSARRANA